MARQRHYVTIKVCRGSEGKRVAGYNSDTTLGTQMELYDKINETLQKASNEIHEILPTDIDHLVLMAEFRAPFDVSRMKISSINLETKTKK